MPDKELTKSQIFADVTIHAGYKILMEEIIGKIINDAAGLVWDSRSPEERAARVEMVASWKALMTTVNAKIANTLQDAQQQNMKGKQDVQKTQRPGRR